MKSPLIAALLSVCTSSAFAQDLADLPPMQWVAEECKATVHQNEKAVAAAVLNYLGQKNLGVEFVVNRSRSPFANPQSPCSVHIEMEIASRGSERHPDDHFAAMLVRYAPGIHFHSYLTATVDASDEPLTADEAQQFVDKWIRTREPVMVYQRGANATTEDDIRVCRIPLERYAGTATDWTDCQTIDGVRRRW